MSGGLRYLWAFIKLALLVVLVGGCCYLMTVPLENFLMDTYWRQDHMDNEAVYEARQDVDETRYKEAQRFTALLADTNGNVTTTQTFLRDYFLKVYGSNFTTAPQLVTEKWTPKLWVSLNNVLLKQDPLPMVSNRDVMAILKVAMMVVGTVFSILAVGTMSIAIYALFALLARLVCLRNGAFAGLLLFLLTFVWAVGMIFLVATLPKYSSMLTGIADAVYKMVGFYQERTAEDNKVALMELVTRLLLLSAHGAFVFSVIDFLFTVEGYCGGYFTPGELRFFQIYQAHRIAKDKKNQ